MSFEAYNRLPLKLRNIRPASLRFGQGTHTALAPAAAVLAQVPAARPSPAHASAETYKLPAMLVSDFHYDLPKELIAQEPLPERASSRMLHWNRQTGCRDRMFREFPDLLRPDDLLVLNNTR